MLTNKVALAHILQTKIIGSTNYFFHDKLEHLFKALTDFKKIEEKLNIKKILFFFQKNIA